MGMRILLVDDHKLVRAGIRVLLEGISDVEQVSEASNGIVALSMIETLRPDLVLTDLAMPEMGGLELAARVAERFPEVKVVILTMHREEEYVGQAIEAGAMGYLLKDSEGEELALALRAVSRGEAYLSPAASAQMVQGYRRRARGEPAVNEILTPRQTEVLRLVAEGHTTKSIARELGLSVKTIEAHRTQLMDRLALHDVAGLVRYAIGIGLVRPGR